MSTIVQDWIDLKIRMHPDQGLRIEGLSERVLGKPDDLLPIVEVGTKRRAVCDTNKNATSSRSHAVLVVTIDIDLPPNFNTGRGATHTVARMNLVDLVSRHVGFKRALLVFSAA